MKILYYSIVFLFISNIVFSQGSNYALLFNGVDNFVSVAHNNVFNVSKVTLEAWIYWEETDGSNVDFVIGKSLEQFEIHTGGGSGTFGLRFIPTAGVYLDAPAGIISTNNWYHIAFEYDPSSSFAKGYINGVEVALTNHGTNPVTTSIITSSNDFNIAKRIDNSYYFKGKIDEIRIWNTIRTGEEINANMNSELTGSETGLIAYYKMSNGSGSTLDDNQVNGWNSGTIAGATWIISDAPLPVELTSFTANYVGGKVLINWQTATEVNNYGFQVERKKAKKESETWEKIGFVQGSGNSNSPKNYLFIDNLAHAHNLTLNPGNEVIQYRLKQIDFDGRYEYSNIAEVKVEAPKQFALEQNYPNPFNPTTTIKYSIPSLETTRRLVSTTLKIYDILGREVATIVNEQKAPGTYEVKFNASELASGVYFYKLSAGSFSLSKKMNIIK